MNFWGCQIASELASKQAYLHMWVRNTNMRLTQALLIIINESDDSDVDVSLQDDHAILLQWLNGIAKKCMHELLVTNNSNTCTSQLHVLNKPLDRLIGVT